VHVPGLAEDMRKASSPDARCVRAVVEHVRAAYVGQCAAMFAVLCFLYIQHQ